MDVGPLLKGAKGSHLRTAFALTANVQKMAETWGLERLGFLTLTFAQNVQDIREARRRFHSLRTHVLTERYGGAIAVVERQKSGRVHFHVLVALGEDIRTGVDFEAFGRGDYCTAGAALRSEWAFWRRTAKLYGFGRTELLPVRSTQEGIARYVGKYIGKHMDQRRAEDKGARLVSYSKGARFQGTAFAWVSPRAWLWRRKLQKWAESSGFSSELQIRAAYGPRWAFHLAGEIQGFPLDAWPSAKVARLDESAPSSVAEIPEDALDVTCERPEVAERRAPEGVAWGHWRWGHIGRRVAERPGATVWLPGGEALPVSASKCFQVLASAQAKRGG